FACEGKDSVFTPDATKLFQLIRKIDPEVPGFQRPALKPEIVEQLVGSATDLPWLKETWNIAFDAVDYDAAFKARKKTVAPTAIGDICAVDFGRRERLL